MRLEPFTADHFMNIEWQDAQRPWETYASREIAELWEEFGEGMSLLTDEGEVIATAGVMPTRVLLDGEVETPLASHAVAVFSPRFASHIKLILRAIRQFLNARPEHRITMYVWPAHTKAARFAKRLGFVFERAVYEDAIGAFVHLYARVRH